MEIYRNMAREMPRILADLRQKMKELASQRDEAQQENARLKIRVGALEEQLSEARKDLDASQMEIDFLTVSHRLAEDPDHLISARRRLQRLISKIDRCVSLLKEDAEIS